MDFSRMSFSFDRRAGVVPCFPAAGHRINVGVAHALEVVGGEGGAVAAAAVEYEFGRVVGDGRLDVALDDAAAHVGGSVRVAALPLVVLAHVYEARAGLQAFERLFDINLADARL